ncbi:MAG TPA: hypothetical protein VIN40_10690 [Candidatus Tyrphobacter sp.]
MKVLALLLAAAFFVIGLLYGLGILQIFTREGVGHHYTHWILLWILALLSLIWARFQR